MFSRVLVANRGEIALRIVRACHDLGIEAVVAHSEADQNSLAARLADKTICIGPPLAARSYLNPPAIVSAAQVTGCDAIHPGYGFLAESAYFAELCAEYGVTFVGPHPEVLRLMANKSIGRETMRAAGIAILPGSEGEIQSTDQALEVARDIGYPVMLKPSTGGGGRGVRVACNEAELIKGYPTARAEAEAAFGRPDLVLEKYLSRVRHVEVQLLADTYGHAVHLGERDCSAQRRHQKIVEESPSPAVTLEIRERMCATALHGIQHIHYSNAGTMEFLLDEEGNFYFIELNARIQVEHPVTEFVTGIDLVKWQLLLAAGKPLTLNQNDIVLRGHAIECRLNAEDPERDFLPVSGSIELFIPPGGPGVRVDSHIYSGYTLPRAYDSLLGKIVTWGKDRTEALNRMRRALKECVIAGIQTTIPFQLAMLDDPVYQSGKISTRYVADLMERWKNAA